MTTSTTLQRAPDLVLLDGDGRERPLSEFWQDGPAVFVFLRYFGCTFCRAHAVSVRDEREAFADEGARVVMVGQGRPEQAAAFCRERNLPFECTVDPEREAYRAFGLGQARFRDLVSPAVAARAARLARDAETRQGAIGGSPRQLGGTVVVDRAGVVRFVHRNASVWDDAPTDVVLEAVRQARRADVRGEPWPRAS
jgi:peroxiredoxin